MRWCPSCHSYISKDGHHLTGGAHLNFMMTNNEVCDILQQIGELLELKGENPFKYRAYFNAVQIIRSLDVSLKELIDQGKLSSIKGIGKALTKKITELVETGNLEYYENLKLSVPSGLAEIASLPGLDRRKIGLLYLKLGVSTPGELEQACREDRVCTVRGFSKKDQQKLLEELKKKRNANG